MTPTTCSSPASTINPSDAAGAAWPPSAITRPARPRRARWSAEQKADLLARFAASGLKAAEFCRRHHLSPATFSCWCRRSAARSTSPAVPAFAQVQFDTASAAVADTDAPLVIRIGGDISFAVHSGTDPVWLARLLRHLRGA